MPSNVEEVTDAVNELNKKVEVRAGLIEQIARAVSTMRSETSSGIAAIMLNVGLNQGDNYALQKNMRIANTNQAELVKIPNRLRS